MTGPELDANGRVVGVVLKSGEKVYGDAVIAADGAYSPIKRALKIDSEYNGYSAIAIRSEMHANRPDSDSLDIYLKLEFKGDQLPGYGWVFPIGGGRINIGLGYVNSYKNWQSINATQFLGEFMRTLPREWDLPAIEELKKNKSRAGVAAADGLHRVAAVASGRAVHRRLARCGQAGVGCGHLQGARIGPGRGRVRDRRADERRPRRLHQLRAADGSGVGQGVPARPLLPQAGGHPGVANTGIKLIDNAVLPRPDAQVAVQEGTGPAAPGEAVTSPDRRGTPT